MNRKKGRRGQRLLTALLCLALCAADIMPVSMTAWASEQMPQNIAADDNVSGSADEGNNAAQDQNDADEGKGDLGDSEDSADNEDSNDFGNQADLDDEESSEDRGTSEDTEDSDDEETDGDLEDDDSDLEDSEDESEEAGEEEDSGEGTEYPENAEKTEADVNGVVNQTAGLEGTFAEDDIAHGVTNEITWRIDKDGNLTVEGTGDYERYNDHFAPWHKDTYKIKTAKIDVTGMMDASYMFYNCSNLTELDFSGFETSDITDMSWMFNGCSSLTKLDLSGFDASKVISMAYMFGYCYGLTELTITDFKTDSLKDTSYMFDHCSILEKLDLGGFDTSSVTNMQSMFYWCNNLRELDISGFRTNNVENMSEMFFHCDSLEELNVSHFNTESVEDMSAMFCACSSLTTLDISNFDTQNVQSMRGMFDGCRNLSELNISGLKTGNVINMRYMFYLCNSLTELDVSSFDTSKVIDMGSMFQDCTGLEELDVSNFNTGSVTDMSLMFLNCSSLKELDISNFDIQSVYNMEQIVAYCDDLTSVNMCGLDASNVVGMDNLFLRSQNLSTIYTPINVKTDYPPSLPTEKDSDVWYRSDNGLKTETLPRNLSYSILLTRNEKAETGSHIMASKTKTDYQCGDTVKTDDLSVIYFRSNGRAVKLTNGEYTTNVDAINESMATIGTKTLTVTYDNGGSPLTADIILTVRYGLDEAHAIITLEDADSPVYDGTPQTPAPTVLYYPNGDVTTEGDMNVTKFALEAGKDYTVSYRNNVNAFEDIEGNSKSTAPTVVITGIGDYRGTLTTVFAIEKAPAFADEELKAYAKECQTEKADRKLDLSNSFAACGEKTGYQILSVVEDNTIEGNVFSVVPTADSIDENGVLTYSTTAGTEGDFATVTVQVSFVNYKDANLIVTIIMSDKELVMISGITITDSIYTGRPVTHSGTASVRREDGADVTEKVKLIYTYSGMKVDGSAYPETGTDAVESAASAPTDAGAYILTVTVESEDYRGSVEYPFTIRKAALTISVKDITLTKEEIKDALPDSYDYDVIGILGEDILNRLPVFSYIDQSGMDITAEQIDRTKEGIYYIIPSGADAGMNYEISYRRGMLIIADEKVAYSVIFNMMGHGSNIAPITGIKAGSLITEPTAPEAEGYVFTGWYKDTTFAAKQKWNFDTDTVQADTTLHACWIEKAAEDGNGIQLSIQDIQDQYFTGSAIKPTVYVYTADGRTLLKSGKDYTIKYVDNTNVGEARVTITGRGNYKETVDKNFTILPAKISADDEIVAAGFTLKYTEQLVVNKSKVQKPFTSLKYKKAMKAGKDYEVELTALKAYDADDTAVPEGEVVSASDGSTLPTIPKGYHGTFRMIVTGKGNYTGSFAKTIIVAGKNQLMKNASISLGKNLKVKDYNKGNEVVLTPGWYDASTKKYYKVEGGSINSEPETNGNDVFTVKAGTEYLICGKGRDYTVSYTNNTAVGTATMTITGNLERGYYGSKSVTFKIKGTAFSTKNVTIVDEKIGAEGEIALMASMPYTGRAITQNNVTLKPSMAAIQNGTSSEPLIYGKHYTISYKNNIKKGTATMTFTAKPESGYSGSFKKTFKITAQSIAAADVVKVGAVQSEGHEQDNIVGLNNTEGNITGYRLNGDIAYVKGGVKPSDRIVLTNSENITLKEGTDYTVKYKNNAAVTAPDTAEDKKPYMTVTGKGNYTGSLTVYFDITQAELTEGQITVTPVALSTKDNYEYKPSVKVTDNVSGKVLSAGENKDYTITYENNGQENVTKYVNGDVSAAQPMAVVKVPSSGTGSYKLAEGVSEIKVPLPIYQTKLTSSNLYVIVSEDPAQITYTGDTGTDERIRPVTPDVTVYYGEAAAVKAAKQNKVTDETELTKQDGAYKLIKLKEVSAVSDGQTDTASSGTGDYTVSYGANVTAGKNKGTVTITGTGVYGGSVTVKFEILKRSVYVAP